MTSALRVLWTFFTALPLQRWLAGSGAVLGGLLALAGAVLQQPFWTFGLLVLFILAAFPALFASAAVFRALSAPRANQMLPHFRARMLAAVALFLAALIASFALLLFALSSLGDRTTVPLEPLLYAFAFATATFMLMFLQFGDWRWMWLWIGAAVGLGVLGISAGAALGAVPVWAWPGAALAAWLGFGVWYLRARRIRPLMLVPQPRAGAWARVDLEGTVTRESALRALVTAQPPGAGTRTHWTVIGLVLGTLLVASWFTPAGRFLPFTSFLWPFAMMIGAWSTATGIVHRSRLLWLRMPGSRAAVRRVVERALLRRLGGPMLMLLGAAALYASPLVAVPPLEVLAGFVLAACACLFGTYAALAAIPGNMAQLATFAVLMVAQFGLLSRPSPPLTDVVIVTAIELIGAVAFRAFAMARWRRVDWLRLRPLSQSNMFRDT